MTAEAWIPFVVESSYGHRFMGTDTPEHEACLICGGMWELVNRGDDTGRYQSADGSAPADCTGDTGQAHGYPGERYCHEHTAPRDYSDHDCSHVDHDCNCLFCA
jgi:hypothetical protein